MPQRSLVALAWFTCVSIFLLSLEAAAPLILIDHPSPAADAAFGTGLAGIGDVNRDGTPDLVSGAPGANKAFLISGDDHSLIRTLSDPEGATDLNFGFAIAGTGDITGDGVEDIAVGAPGPLGLSVPLPCDPSLGDACPPAAWGRVFLFNGATGSVIRKIVPATPSFLKFGFTVADLGDVNGDSVRDLAVGSPVLEGFRGQVYTFSGATGTQLWMTQEPGADRQAIGSLGEFIAPISDINGDGSRDLIAAAPFFDNDPTMSGFALTGKVFVLSGANGAILREHLAAVPVDGGFYGGKVSSVGDQNGDGAEDYLIGDRGHAAIDLRSGATGEVIGVLPCPVSDNDSEFYSLARAGDHSGDGVEDFWVGLPAAGTAYLLAGDGTAVLQVSDPSMPTPGANAFAIQIAALADINGDAKPEVLIAKPGEMVSGFSSAGAVFLVTSNRMSDANAGPAPLESMEIDESGLLLQAVTTSSKAGYFDTTTSAGNMTVTVGFQPKVVLFFGTAGSTDGSYAGFRSSMGVGVSSTSRWAVSAVASDAVSPADSARTLVTNRCYRDINSSRTVLLDIDFVSQSSTGFTVNVVTPFTSSRRVYYVALGGDAITNVKAGTFNYGTTAGSLAVTGFGFQPDLVLIGGAISGTTEGIYPHGTFDFGMAYSKLSGVLPAQWSTSWFATDALTAADAARTQRTDRIIYRTDAAGPAPYLDAHITKMDSGGFTLNRNIAYSANARFVYLAMKGGYDAKVSYFAQKTSTGSQTVTTDFQPAVALLASNRGVARTAPVVDAAIAIGAASATTSRWAFAGAATDAVNPSQADRKWTTTKVISFVNSTASGLVVPAEADISAMGTSSFTLNWTAADSAPRQILYFAISSTSGGAPPTEMSASQDFEGGNCVASVLDETNNRAVVASILKGGDTRAYHAYCRIDGISTASPFKVRINNAFGLPWNPMYSYNNIAWSRLGEPDGSGYSPARTYTSSTIYVANGYPYTYTKLVNYVASLSSSHLTKSTVTSEGGRSVSILKITDAAYVASGKALVWWMGRQHAFESNANYVTEGLVNWLLSSDPQAVDLRRRAIVYVVPMLDVDGVAQGHTGKDQTPVDFNRGWAATTPYWDAAAAIKQMIINTAAQNPIRLVVDAHDPSTQDTTGNRSGVFAYRSTSNATKITALRTFLGEYNAAAGFICAEVDDSVNENSSVYFDNFVKNTFPENEVAVGLEHGWVEDPSGALWTTTSYRTSGANWGKAIYRYLF